jgi:hypothetical protein
MRGKQNGRSLCIDQNGLPSLQGFKNGRLQFKRSDIYIGDYSWQDIVIMIIAISKNDEICTEEF